MVGTGVEVRYLPAHLHNRPERIAPAVEAMLDEGGGDRPVFVAYADLGGALGDLRRRGPIEITGPSSSSMVLRMRRSRPGATIGCTTTSASAPRAVLHRLHGLGHVVGVSEIESDTGADRPSEVAVLGLDRDGIADDSAIATASAGGPRRVSGRSRRTPGGRPRRRRHRASSVRPPARSAIVTAAARSMSPTSSSSASASVASQAPYRWDRPSTPAACSGKANAGSDEPGRKRAVATTHQHGDDRLGRPRRRRLDRGDRRVDGVGERRRVDDEHAVDVVVREGGRERRRRSRLGRRPPVEGHGRLDRLQARRCRARPGAEDRRAAGVGRSRRPGARAGSAGWRARAPCRASSATVGTSISPACW